MSTTSSTTSHSAPVISIDNLHFDYPDADIVLRSHDSLEFRVPKIYIVHSSPILDEVVSISLNTHPVTSAIPAESEIGGPTSTDALQTVELPIDGAILLSLLSYIFPVPPMLPSTTEEIMELLSVAQMYKMDIVLTRIRSHIAEQNPSFVRKETAYLVYTLAQEYGLRTEALQAARCTLSTTFTIQELSSEGKLDMMPGAALHELWKYHQRVQSNLTSDLKEFRTSQAPVILGDSNCVPLTDSGIPRWLDKYISALGSAHVPTGLDFIEFSMKLTEHIRCQSSESDGESSSCACAYIPREKIHTFWDTLTVAVDDSITKVRAQVANVATLSKQPIQAESDFALVVAGTGTTSAGQDRSPSDSEAHSPPKYSDMPDADIILESSDLIHFRVHKSVLVTSSPFFRDMFSLPQPTTGESHDGLPLVHLSEDTDVLNSLVSMLYPVTPDIPDSNDSILALLAATQKYDMVSVQSSIRAEVSRRKLLSPTGVEAFRVYAIACGKRLFPEMVAMARLSLHYPMTFEGLGEALRSFEGWALRDLACFRLSCTTKLSSQIRSFLDCRDEHSTYWRGCPRSLPRYDRRRLPVWLRTHFTQALEDLKKSTHIIPEPQTLSGSSLVALHAHIKENTCDFCMKVYTLKGVGFLSWIREWVELARNVPYPNSFGEREGWQDKNV